MVTSRTSTRRPAGTDASWHMSAVTRWHRACGAAIEHNRAAHGNGRWRDSNLTRPRGDRPAAAALCRKDCQARCPARRRPACLLDAPGSRSRAARQAQSRCAASVQLLAPVRVASKRLRRACNGHNDFSQIQSFPVFGNPSKHHEALHARRRSSRVHAGSP